MIKIVDMKKVYGKEDSIVYALQGLTININKGEMIAVMGTSGSGKSTLLNIIGCLDKSTSGEYYLNNKNINQYKERELALLRNKTFGFVVQNFALIEDYTVYENVVIPLEYSKLSRNQKKLKVKELLKKLGIENKINNLPSELSGGQCQRVAIARALVNEPEIILADEPTGALDQRNSEEIMAILKELNVEGKTVVVITHDINIAKKCNRIIELEDGKIKQ